MEGCLVIWEPVKLQGALGRLRESLGESSFVGPPYMGPSSGLRKKGFPMGNAFEKGI